MTITNGGGDTTSALDLSGSYDLNQNLRLSAGVNNLFGLTPPVTVKSGYGNTWPATYDAFGQTFFFSVTARMD